MFCWKSTGITYSGALECDIDFVERRIDINLPEEYVELIKEHNGGYVKNKEFVYRNANNEIELGSMYMLNLFDILKEYINPPEFFPKRLVPFAEDGGGNLTCFDYRETKINPSIVFWVHDDPEGNDVHFVANNFEEFINMLHEPED